MGEEEQVWPPGALDWCTRTFLTLDSACTSRNLPAFGGEEWGLWEGEKAQPGPVRQGSADKPLESRKDLLLRIFHFIKKVSFTGVSYMD